MDMRDKQAFEASLEAWGKSLAETRLPRWEDFPDFDLYMDQIVYLVPGYLEFMGNSAGEKILTPAMINNYTKQGIMPRPHKKHYHREHLAHLVIIVLLKPIFPLPTIQQGIERQLEALDGDIHRGYNMFCRLQEHALRNIAHLACHEPSNDRLAERLPSYMLGTYMATRAISARIMADKVLEFLDE